MHRQRYVHYLPIFLEGFDGKFPLCFHCCELGSLYGWFRNPGSTHQLRLVDFLIIYKVLGPSQVVGLRISGCHQQYVFRFPTIDRATFWILQAS